ncbi:MAG: hypothetical protein JNM78_12625 [Cyclobacteriaceae bacterium]|nr:hypothetical protein [Cyclobacteriaceae bacterium]
MKGKLLLLKYQWLAKQTEPFPALPEGYISYFDIEVNGFNTSTGKK